MNFYNNIDIGKNWKFVDSLFYPDPPTNFELVIPPSIITQNGYATTILTNQIVPSDGTVVTIGSRTYTYNESAALWYDMDLVGNTDLYVSILSDASREVDMSFTYYPDLFLTAIVAGTAGNSIVTDVTPAQTGLSFPSATMTGAGNNPGFNSGMQYYIQNYVAGDDFSNIGGSNVTGSIFYASGTAAANFTNGSTVYGTIPSEGTVFFISDLGETLTFTGGNWVGSVFGPYGSTANDWRSLSAAITNYSTFFWPNVKFNTTFDWTTLTIKLTHKPGQTGGYITLDLPGAESYTLNGSSFGNAGLNTSPTALVSTIGKTTNSPNAILGTLRVGETANIVGDTQVDGNTTLQYTKIGKGLLVGSIETGAVTLGTHAVEIVTDDPGKVPLTIIGGTGNIQYWLDMTPTKAFSWGISEPYTTPDGNFHISRFSPGWSTVLTITNDNGYVGIGTTTPTNNLHIQGGFTLENGTQAPGRVLTTDFSGVATWQDPSAAGLTLSYWGETVSGTPSIHFTPNTSNILDMVVPSVTPSDGTIFTIYQGNGSVPSFWVYDAAASDWLFGGVSGGNGPDWPSLIAIIPTISTGWDYILAWDSVTSTIRFYLKNTSTVSSVSLTLTSPETYTMNGLPFGNAGVNTKDIKHYRLGYYPYNVVGKITSGDIEIIGGGMPKSITVSTSLNTIASDLTISSGNSGDAYNGGTLYLKGGDSVGGDGGSVHINGGLSIASVVSDIFIQENGGRIGIGTGLSSSKVTINNAADPSAQLRLISSFTPTSTNDTSGNPGDFAWDDGYLYIKTNAGWKRSALSTF